MATIALTSSSGMDCYGAGTCFLDTFCYFNCIYAIFIPTTSDFTVTGTLTALTTADTISFIFDGFLEEHCLPDFYCYFRDRTPHIYINYVWVHIIFYFFAASTNDVRSLPKICWAIGRSLSFIFKSS